MVPIDELNLKDNKDIEKEYIKQNNILTIYKSLQKLDTTTREVMYLRITGNFTFKEIASILNKSENWARVTFFRGKQKLEWENIE